MLAFLLLLAACFRYDPVALTQLRGNQIPTGTRLRIHFRDEHRDTVLLKLEQVRFPVVTGLVYEGVAPGERKPVRRRIDLRQAKAIEIQELDQAKTALAVLVPLVVVGGLVLIVALTKESCPIVYVDRGRGPELVGEAYAGAAFRALEREDLLPIPSFAATDRVSLMLANQAHETQYTDLARLVVVDHAPTSRVLSSHEAQLLTVGNAQPARSVMGAERQRFDAALAQADGLLWESDMEAMAAASDPPRSDGVSARFEAPPGDGPLVLELVASNTHLLDLTFGRFFAAMGDRLDEYLTKGNDRAAAERLGEWRRREGVDLTVEVLEAGVWRRAAVVPTVGPMALREIAVALPPRAPGQPLEVRLTGGTGFWRIDRLALSRGTGESIEVHELGLSEARSAGGEDQRALLATVDGRYQVLARRGEVIALQFLAPPLRTDRARSTFFRSSGYYNVHPPFEHEYKPGNLLVAAREEGGLSRFALDLYREYQKLARAPAPSEAP